MNQILKVIVFAVFMCASFGAQKHLDAQKYPVTRRGQFVPRPANQGAIPRNSNWAVSQPAAVDRPGYSEAFAPQGFPELPVADRDLGDVSMSPDDWGESGQQAIAKGDLSRPAFVQRFPSEKLRMNETGAGKRTRSMVENSGKKNFRPANSQSRTVIEEPIPGVPSEIGQGTVQDGLSGGAMELPVYNGAELIDQGSTGQFVPSPNSQPRQIELPNAYPGIAADPAPSLQSTIPTPAFPSLQLQGTAPRSEFGELQSLGSTMAGELLSYRPDLGHRRANVQFRPAQPVDMGERFDFEDKKQEYPPFREILATGRYFFSADANLLKPYFQNNNSIASTQSGVTNAGTFDFGYYLSPAFRAGFESKYGPGLELTFLQYDQDSRPSRFTASGVETGRIQAVLPEGGAFSSLSANNAGEMLTAEHGIDVQLIGVSFFKEIKFPIARLNGIFGLHHASISQQMRAELSSGGSTLGTLVSQSNMDAIGPRVMFEYFRPIGHTKLTLVAKFGGSMMVGNRDHFVSNSLTGVSSRIGSDELLTMFDLGLAVMYKRPFGENRYFYGKFGYDTQNWLGGGNGTDPQSDFGLRGLVFTIGINR